MSHQAPGSSPCARCCSLPPKHKLADGKLFGAGNEPATAAACPALPNPLCCGADGHLHSAQVVVQRSTGSYGPLRKKHLCKGNSFPFPPPAWPQPSGAFRKVKISSSWPEQEQFLYSSGREKNCTNYHFVPGQRIPLPRFAGEDQGSHSTCSMFLLGAAP